MSPFWDMVLSPTGLMLYAAFWAFKILAGAWMLRKAMLLLPVRAQSWTEDKLGRIKLRGRGRRRLG
ncbi:hypothetical protein ANTHELSMS3_03100 [Antarctobacter heliothermus]|uniref:Uncharacterized protein n=1 Tax=Antarctobacter heliothermus TaxID=74033 RepID=A0A222E6G9_9RHOB|nr:hypothetical protein [Antarctobacter heliothermus]ASP21752.1 hypothetical protein ANTHELSMS3_03100 [Antarctobacter heliothermus]